MLLVAVVGVLVDSSFVYMVSEAFQNFGVHLFHLTPNRSQTVKEVKSPLDF